MLPRTFVCSLARAALAASGAKAGATVLILQDSEELT